jgi:hypothetical protein
MRFSKSIYAYVVFLSLACQQYPQVDLDAIFNNPPKSAKPWTYWYWVNAAVSEEGITADLEAMQ